MWCPPCVPRPVGTGRCCPECATVPEHHPPSPAGSLARGRRRHQGCGLRGADSEHVGGPGPFLGLLLHGSGHSQAASLSSGPSAVCPHSSAPKATVFVRCHRSPPAQHTKGHSQCIHCVCPHTTTMCPHTTVLSPHTTVLCPHTTAVCPHAAAAPPSLLGAGTASLASLTARR